MIKAFCDRCGREISKNEHVYYLDIKQADGYRVSPPDVDFEADKFYCKECGTAIERFIAGKDDEPPVEPDPEPEPEVEEATEEPKKYKKQFDYGKAIALQKAGWSAKEIAEEMGYTVSTLYTYMSNYKNRGENNDVDR